jgi:hypothetical protein
MAKKVIGLARNVVGKRGSKRRRWAALLSLGLAVSVSFVVMRTVFAVHDLGLFELDRDAINAGATPGEDWDTIFNAQFNNGPTAASAFSFVQDGIGPTIFTGGQSKDDEDTTGWRHKSGQTPDKDELLDGYAARYGDILYFGADRFDGSGSAQMGIWFFQEDVQAQPGGTFGPGQHKNGDVLILSDFTQGGAVTTIRVFKWNSPGGTINGVLDFVAGSQDVPADCVGTPTQPPVPAGDPFCATVNALPTNSPWPFFPKNNPPGIFPGGHFYEGGIDLAFLNLAGQCFASFLIETRSSPSIDAVLKDFVGGRFEACESRTVTTPSDANGLPLNPKQIVLGQSVTDHAVVTGTGSNQAPLGDITFHICSPSELDDPSPTDDPNTCDVGGTLVSTETLTAVDPPTTPPSSQATSDPFQPTSTGIWCWRGDYAGNPIQGYPASSDSSTGECFTVVTLQPTISTAQTWTVKDSATVTVDSGGGNLAGSLVFELYQNSTTCSGTPILTTTKAISGALSSTQDSDTLTITLPAQGTTYSWKVSYTSTNQAHENVTSTCNTENATLSFTNGS